MTDHIFNKDASFVIEQMRKSTLSAETKKKLLKKEELLDCISIVLNLHLSSVHFTNQINHSVRST